MLSRGESMGSRLIEEFLAFSGIGKCHDFQETMEVLAKVCDTIFKFHIILTVSCLIKLF
jgi:trafficking protein particle complex subunit 3